MKNKVGRPSKYNKDILGKTWDYIRNYKKYGDVIPIIEGLSVFIGLNKSTVYDWQNKYPEFSDAIEELLAEQSRCLVKGGLTGDYNPTIAKLLLHARGYSDKVDSTISGPNGKPIETTWKVEVVSPEDNKKKEE